MMVLRKIAALLAACSLLQFSAAASAAPAAPSEIKIGVLYASSGPFAALGMPDYMGLKIWANEVNAEGGAMVKPYGKRIPVKLVAYDDQSDTATASTLYNQLITQDKVNILVADGGSVLTSMAVPIAREHKMLLFDQTGSGSSFFTKDNPYIVLTSVPASNHWSRYVGEFFGTEVPKLGAKRVAILYATNEYTSTQANTVREILKKDGADIVYDQGVPTSTSDYTVLINNIRAHQPDAVLEFGYPNNDTAFLRNLESSGVHFKSLFTMYAGLEFDHLSKTVGTQGLQYVYTYLPPSSIDYPVTSGMTQTQFRAAWDKAYPKTDVSYGLNAITGYTTGVVIQNALSTTESMDQLALRKAVGELSGKLKTLDGPFAIDDTGAQVGELMPVTQLVPDGKNGLKFAVLYPADVANAKPVYPAPEK